MALSVDAFPCRRGALRRYVALECRVRSALWDGEVSLRSGDLSPRGMWLSCPLPLEAGERLTLRFRPPGWPAAQRALEVIAEVVRAPLPRRRSEPQGAGMGLCFVDLSEGDRARLAQALCGLPPPLPHAGNDRQRPALTFS